MQNVAMMMMMTVPGRMWMKRKRTMQREMISTLVVRIIIVRKVLVSRRLIICNPVLSEHFTFATKSNELVR